MQLPIGEVINTLRKEKGVTQEQLANAVGVSVPAVSKWESGSAYPDITMLPSIARYFNTTIDFLLKYQKELTNSDVMEIVSQCSKNFEANTLYGSIEMCEEFLRQYPNSMLLKLRIASLYMSYLGRAADDKEIKFISDKAITLLEQSVQSGEPEISTASSFVLSSLYSIRGDNGKAEKILSAMPKNMMDPDDMLVTVYIGQGKLEEAKKLLQTGIWKKLWSIIGALSSYSHIHTLETDAESAEEVLLLQRRLIKAFEIEEVILPVNSLALCQFYTKQKDSEKAITYLDEYVSSTLQKHRDLSEHKLFGSIKLSSTYPSDNYLKQMTQKLVEENDEFYFIRSDVRFKAIVEKLAGSNFCR